MSDHPTTTDGAHSRRRFLAAGAVAATGLALPPLAGAQLPSPERASGPFLYWPDRPFYSFQLLRLIGVGVAGGSDFSEAFVAAQAIGRSPDEQRWVREYERLGGELVDRATELDAEDSAAARATALRAVSYLRSAEFFIPSVGPELDRKIALYRRIRRAFAAATAGIRPRIEPVDVPYGRTALHAYFVHPEGAAGRRRPAVVFFGGLDSLGEETYLWAGLELARRGIGVLIVDGPGNGASLRLRNITSRHDYEVAARAAVDYLVRRPEVDAGRLGLIGISLGGYYAARSAAFEHRLRATVVWGAIWDVPEITRRQTDPETSRFLLLQGMWVFGANNPAEAALKASQFRMEGVAHRIRNPILILHGEDDRLVPVDQAHRLHDAIRAPKALHIVPKGTPGSTHCQADSIPAAWDVMLPWLLDQLDADRPGPPRRRRRRRGR
jgi:dienelactone hydrolase